MVTFVLDASAVIRFFDNEPGAARVEEIFEMLKAGTCRVVISAVNWGEVVGKLTERMGRRTSEELTSRVVGFGVDVVPANAVRAERSALIKLQHGIPYADCFGVELASDSPSHVLVTADFDVKPAERQIRIEFLPTKPKP